MAKAPAFQFYAKEWLSSSRIALMTVEQEGAYIRLLAVCWDSGDCSIPNDDRALATLSRIGKRWSKCGDQVRACFVEHPDKPGFLTNDRLIVEHRKQAEWREKCKKGGLAKALVNGKGSTSLPHASDVLDGCIASASADCILPLPPKGESATHRKEEIEAAICEVSDLQHSGEISELADELLAKVPPIVVYELKEFGRRYHQICTYSGAKSRSHPTLNEIRKYVHRVRTRAAKAEAKYAPLNLPEISPEEAEKAAKLLRERRR